MIILLFMIVFDIKNNIYGRQIKSFFVLFSFRTVVAGCKKMNIKNILYIKGKIQLPVYLLKHVLYLVHTDRNEVNLSNRSLGEWRGLTFTIVHCHSGVLQFKSHQGEIFLIGSQTT